MSTTAQTAAGNYRGADSTIAATFSSAVPSPFGSSVPAEPFGQVGPFGSSG